MFFQIYPSRYSALLMFPFLLYDAFACGGGIGWREGKCIQSHGGGAPDFISLMFITTFSLLPPARRAGRMALKSDGVGQKLFFHLQL